MAMMHNNIMSYYERIFAFKQYHGWSVFEIEDLLPWELDVMMSLLSGYLEKKELDMKQSRLNSQL